MDSANPLTRNQELGVLVVLIAVIGPLSPLADGHPAGRCIVGAISAGLSARAGYLLKSEPRASEAPPIT